MSCFHSIGFPCERGTKLYSLQPGIRIRVSIQLVSPARGELQIQILLSHQQKFPFNWFPLREGNMGLGLVKSHGAMSFHSIGFPCERGTRTLKFIKLRIWEVSIQLVSPARGEPTIVFNPYPQQPKGFHSIGFPCERGTCGVRAETIAP